jgi:hypothetical protein
VTIPAEVLFNKNLSPREMILFGHLNNMAYNEYGFCWSGNKYLSRLIGVAPETVSSMISKLAKEQYLVLEYETLYDGKEVRRIYINKKYPEIYDETLREAYGKLKDPLRKSLTPLKQNLNTPKAKSQGALRKSLGNIDIDIENDIVKRTLSEPKDSDGENSNPSGKPSIQERNNEYLPKAKRLAEIVQSNKNVKVTQSKLKSWSNEIRKITEQDGIDPSRIDTALDWYAENIGGEFVPVIESASALKRKFINLEEAIKRDTRPSQNNHSKPDQKASPKKIIKQADLPRTNADDFIKYCYEPAKEILSYSNNSQLPELANKLISLYHNLYQQQQKTIDANDLMVGDANQVVHPETIIARYIQWLDRQDWLDDKQPGLFTPNHKLFNKFLNYLKDDNLGYDPITG